MLKTLEGVTVVDLTSATGGGCAYSKLLAEYGAEVILVEQGQTRRTQPSYEFDFYHGGEKSLVLDLEQSAGRQVLHRLLKEADVFITTLDKQKQDAWGISYPVISAMNPRIIYAHGSIYGEDGPLKHEIADPGAVWWTQSGHMWGTMEIGDLPPVPNNGLPEVNVGKSLLLGICAALYRRVKTGKGMYLSVSVLGEAIYDNADTPLEMQYGAEYPKTRKRPRRATLNTYQCKDGWIALITLNFEKDFGNLMEAIGRADLRGDPRWQHIEDVMYDKSVEVVKIMDEALAKMTCDEAVSRIKACDIAVIKIATVADVLKDPQIRANQFLMDHREKDGNIISIPQSPVRFGDYAPAEYQRAPGFGEHTSEVLQRLGYSPSQIEALETSGAIFK